MRHMVWGSNQVRLRLHIAFASILLSSLSGRAANQEASIAGTVVDTLGAELNGATVRILSDVDSKTIYQSRSGAGGRFRVANVEAGQYRVAISTGGFRERVIDGV